MEFRYARDYCLDLLKMRKNIQAAIDKARQRQEKQRIAMLKTAFYDFDPEQDKIMRPLREELPCVNVRYYKTSEIFTLNRPESWIETFRQALGLYKNVYGQKSYTYIVLKYSYRWPVERICRRYQMSRNNFYITHRQFSYILLLIAVQNGLITVEKNTDLKGEDETNED